MQYLHSILKKGTILFICFTLGWGVAKGQANSVSPFTVYGLGDLSEGYFAQNFGIGGTSIGVREPLYINMANPASYTALDFTTLETAMSFKVVEQSIESTNQKLRNQNAYFNYFALGFKIKDWWGMSVSVSPYSFVGYNIFTTDSVADFGDVLYEFQGKGGINQAVFGNGFEIAKNLSVGINMRYLFGSYDRSEAVLFSDKSYYNAKKKTSNGVSSFAFDFGLQYEKHLKENKVVTVGATYANQIDLNAQQDLLQYTFLYGNTGTENIIDTVDASLDVKGKITLPSRYGVGLSYGYKNPDWYGYAWMITGEFSSTNWTRYSNFEGNNGGLKDSWRVAFGGFMVPQYSFEKFKRGKTYFSKIEYRIGGFYENTQVKIEDIGVINYGATAGFGLPFPYKNLAQGEKKYTMLNLGIVVGNKWNGEPDQLKERYVNLIFGITFGDQWFQKFKYR